LRAGFGLRSSARRRLDRWLGRPIPEPPAALAAGVGAGEWRRTGERIAELAVEFGELRPDDRILDLGCGLGRIVQPLRHRLSRRGRYVGLDIAHQYIAWNRAEITTRDSRFQFERIDVRNDLYRPEGAVEAARARFPFPDAAFDFALAFSLFTHLDAAAAERYFEELARVLAPRGRLLATFFVLDGEARARIAAGRCDRRFAHPLPHGATDDAAVPESAIAFDRDWLLATLERSGFRPTRPLERGTWCGEPGGPTYQDLLIATRGTES
jgi:SAM-dependent methyltransferase